MNTLLKCFNSSSCCKRRINNHLHLRGLDPSSFSPFPVCKLLVMWDGYGIHHEHLIGEPQPPEERHLSSNREGAHHILDKISGGGSHCSRWIFRPQQAVCPMQRSSAQTTYQNHHDPLNKKQRKQTKKPQNAQGLTLNSGNQNSERDTGMNIFIFSKFHKKLLS